MVTKDELIQVLRKAEEEIINKNGIEVKSFSITVINGVVIQDGLNPLEVI